MLRTSDLVSLVAVAAFSGIVGLHVIPAPNDGDDHAVDVAPAAMPLYPGALISPVKRVAYSSTAPAHPPKARATPQVASPPAKPQAWTAVVLADPANSTDRLKSSKPGDAMARAELTRELQRELTRVGCYGGEIHGYWTQSTRRAMAVFMDRANAALPIAEPDYIQLSLIKGQSGIVCGAECPAGQVETQSGRCVPHAVVAQASRKAQRAGERTRRDVTEMRPVEDLNRDAGAAAGSATAGAAVLAQREALPWRTQNPALADATAAGPVEPLPGRMSVGGPLPPAGAVAAPAVGASPAPGPNPAIALRPGNAFDRLAALDAPASATTAPVMVGADGRVIPVDAIGKRRPATAPKRKRYYGDGYGYSRSARGQPRRGSMPGIVLEALGGFHR